MTGSDPPLGARPGGAESGETELDSESLFGHEETWLKTISRCGATNVSPDNPCLQYLQHQGLLQGTGVEELTPNAEYSPLKGKRWYVGLSVSGAKGEFLYDTGASHTLISRKFYSKLGGKSEVPKEGIRARTATGDRMTTYGRTVTTMSIGGRAYIVCPLIADITDDGILGMDFAALYGVTLNARTGKMHIEHPYNHSVQCLLRMGNAAS